MSGRPLLSQPACSLEFRPPLVRYVGATYFQLEEEYQGIQPLEMRRLKQLETRTPRGRRSSQTYRWIVRCFRTHPPKTVRPARKRELATVVRDEWSVSIRRASSVLEFDRSFYLQIPLPRAARS